MTPIIQGLPKQSNNIDLTKPRCPVCGAPRAKRNRHCVKHARRAARLGHPEQMPITYRTHVAPKWHGWCLAGFEAHTELPAMRAGRKLAQKCIGYVYKPDPTVARIAGWALAAHGMKLLRDQGVTAEQMMLRYAEMVAALDAEPWRVKGQQAERMAIGRALLHMVRWAKGKQPGKQLILAVADHVAAHLGQWAAAFIRYLQQCDQELVKTHRQAADFGEPVLPSG